MEAAERPVPEPVRLAPPDAVLLVLSNVPDQEVAATIARALVDERLAACVNILGACRSIYRWRGAVEEAEEVTLLVKTTRRRHAACRQRLKALHPYEVPELVALPIESGHSPYLDWLDESVS